MLNYSDFLIILNQKGDFRSFSFNDSIHQNFFPKILEIDPLTVTHGKEAT